MGAGEAAVLARRTEAVMIGVWSAGWGAGLWFTSTGCAACEHVGAFRPLHWRCNAGGPAATVSAG